MASFLAVAVLVYNVNVYIVNGVGHLVSHGLSVSIFDMRSVHLVHSIGAGTNSQMPFNIESGIIRGVQLSYDSDSWAWQSTDRVYVEVILAGSPFIMFDTAQQNGPGLVHAATFFGWNGVPPNSNSLFPLDFKFKRPLVPILTLRSTAWAGAQTVFYVSCTLFLA